MLAFFAPGPIEIVLFVVSIVIGVRLVFLLLKWLGLRV